MSMSVSVLNTFTVQCKIHSKLDRHLRLSLYAELPQDLSQHLQRMRLNGLLFRTAQKCGLQHAHYTSSPLLGTSTTTFVRYSKEPSYPIH